MRSRPASRGPALGPSPFLPPSFFRLSFSPVSGARGRGRRAPLSGAPRRQGRGWAPAGLPFPPAAEPARASPRRPGSAWRPGTFPAEVRVSSLGSSSPSGPSLRARLLCLFSPPDSASVPQDFPPGPGGRFPAPFPRPLPETRRDGQVESSA